MCFFCICTLFSGARGSFLVRSDAGHAGGPPAYHGASLGPGRTPCSGRSKSGNMASNHGVAFRGGRPEQDNGKPTCQLFCSTAVKTFHLVAATIQEQSHIKFV